MLTLYCIYVLPSSSFKCAPVCISNVYLYRSDPTSLSTIVLNSRDRQGMYGMQHFRMPRNAPYNIGFSQKTDLNALVQL